MCVVLAISSDRHIHRRHRGVDRRGLHHDHHDDSPSHAWLVLHAPLAVSLRLHDVPPLYVDALPVRVLAVCDGHVSLMFPCLKRVSVEMVVKPLTYSA